MLTVPVNVSLSSYAHCHTHCHTMPGARCLSRYACHTVPLIVDLKQHGSQDVPVIACTDDGNTVSSRNYFVYRQHCILHYHTPALANFQYLGDMPNIV